VKGSSAKSEKGQCCRQCWGRKGAVRGRTGGSAGVLTGTAPAAAGHCLPARHAVRPHTVALRLSSACPRAGSAASLGRCPSLGRTLDPSYKPNKRIRYIYILL
jgi:hypothetical protein